LQPPRPRYPSFAVLEWKRWGCVVYKLSRNWHVVLSSHWPSSVGGEGEGGLHPTGCTGDGHGMNARLRTQTPITKVGRPFEREGGARPVARSWGFVAFFRPGRGRRWALGVRGGAGSVGPGGCGCGKRIREHRQPTPVPTYTHIPGGSPPSHGRIHWHAPVARKPGQVLKKI